MVLLNAFFKKTQKTPQVEIETAIRRIEGSDMSRIRSGSSLDDFLKEDGTYEEVTAKAIKRVLSRQIAELMDKEGLTKSELARRMGTSRAQLDRFLDPDNGSVTLSTLVRAAEAVGRELRLEIV